MTSLGASALTVIVRTTKFEKGSRDMSEEKIDFAAKYRQYRQEQIDAIIRDVAELPDRTSPPDQLDMMMVSRDELTLILMNHL